MNEQEEAALCSPELSDWNPNVTFKAFSLIVHSGLISISFSMSQL